MPAYGIYEEETIAKFKEIIARCHIYIIGLTPKIELVGAIQEARELITYHIASGRKHELRWPLPEGASLGTDENGGFYLSDGTGRKYFPSQEITMKRLSTIAPEVSFKILYIGQAFGDEGSRNALDRLKKHETLQKISLQGIPSDMSLTLLMLEVEPSNRIITMFNPWAKNKEESESRIDNGLDKLLETTEAERTTLYEASLIRYYRPKFNKEFKNSFPSTNLKILSECYDKDFSSVSSELNLEGFALRIGSEAVNPEWGAIAHHDLHTDADRKVFYLEKD